MSNEEIEVIDLHKDINPTPQEMTQEEIDALAREIVSEQLQTVQDEDVAWVQRWLNERAGVNLVVDGVGGSLTRAAFITAFANRNAQAITQSELLQIAQSLGDVDTRRIVAVANVESAGGGWFNSGLPKILFERHKFWKHTTRPKQITWYSNPNAGGYTMDANGNGMNDSWEKLSYAVCKDPLAALKSISIGKFQVMGEYYRQCGYDHPIEMLWAARNSELAHYQMLRDYILNVADLKDEFLKLGRNADANRAFAKGYNGVKYEKFAYHKKLAEALA